MKRLQFAMTLAVLFALATAGAARAFFHAWDFSEVFSSADGTVQFIEMTTTSPSETVAVGIATMFIQSTSTSQTFTFNHNLSGNTTNKRILIATSGFESKPGLPTTPPLLTPDYILDPNFFNQAGDTIRFCQNSCSGLGILDTRTFASLPIDGVTSLHFLPSVTTAENSPTNFAGTTGSVNLTPPPTEPTGDYNGDLVVNAADYTVWQNSLGETVSNNGDGADGDADGMIDDGDYDYWKERFGDVITPGAAAGGASIVPEPPALALVILCLISFLFRAARARL